MTVRLTSGAASRADQLTPSALWSAINRGSPPLVLDVRSSREFTTGRIPGAVHVPFWKLLFDLGGFERPREGGVVVYCGHGPRAWLAATLLRFRGFGSVACLAGHMAEWRRRGLPEDRG